MRLSCSAAILSVLLVGCGDERVADEQKRTDEEQPGGIHAVVTTEVLYEVDGVRVVAESGNGPSQGRMLEARHEFRKAVVEMFELSAVEEYELWHKIAEIRWDDGLVPPIGGTYDPETASLVLEYHGCLIDAPLFQMLATHYYYEMTGGTDLPDAVVQWAEDLSGANTVLCAPED